VLKPFQHDFFAFDSDADGLSGQEQTIFYIQVNNSQLVIESNNVARFYISGQTELPLNFYEGDGHYRAANLTAQNMKLYHRGSNDMIVKPIQGITGKMGKIAET
jgi:hypothetical protein